MRWIPRAMRAAPKLDPTVQTGPPRQRYALLIQPFYPKDPTASFGKHALTPSLALTSIAAATPPEWEVAFWDENLLQGPPPHDPPPRVVGISIHLTFADRAYALARWYRRRGSKVILGGLHVTSCPEEAAPHADALAIGEGVQLWGRILQDVEAGNLRSVYRGDFRRPYREEPAPRRGILPRGDFLTTASLIATRGCHNRCGFCYLATRGVRMPHQTRDIGGVVDEFLATNEPYAVFTDNNLGSRPDYLRRLCHALRPLEKIWSAAVSLDVTDDPAVVREMALAGCTGVFVGFESLNNDNIADARKKGPPAEDYARRVETFHDCGIQVNGSFVFGFDGDGPAVFDETVSWAMENNLDTATFHILTPYPGTPLFRQLAEEGRILDRDWSHYDTAHVVFRPAGMSVDALQTGYERAYDRFYSWGAILQRASADAWGRLPRLMLNVGYKRMNRLWPILGLTGMAKVPFEAFVLSLCAHRRSHEWERAPDESAPPAPEARSTLAKEPALVR